MIVFKMSYQITRISTQTVTLLKPIAARVSYHVLPPPSLPYIPPLPFLTYPPPSSPSIPNLPYPSTPIPSLHPSTPIPHLSSTLIPLHPQPPLSLHPHPFPTSLHPHSSLILHPHPPPPPSLHPLQQEQGSQPLPQVCSRSTAKKRTRVHSSKGAGCVSHPPP